MSNSNEAPDTGSYEREPPGRSFSEEIHRLRAQSELSWTAELRRLEALGIADGLRILELGCGPGFFTRHFVEHFPGCRVTALDIDQQMLDVARKTMGDVDADVAFVAGDAEATGFADDSFDLVLSRYLFQHHARPQAVAAESLRVLRPRGRLIVIDIDDALWGLVDPPLTKFRKWHAERLTLQADRGGDRFVGRRVSRILRDAGCVSVELDVFGYSSDDSGLEPFAAMLTADQFLPLVDVGRMTWDDYLEACALYHQFMQTPGAFVLGVGFIGWGEKP